MFGLGRNLVIKNYFMNIIIEYGQLTDAQAAVYLWQEVSQWLLDHNQALWRPDSFTLAKIEGKSNE
jgi:hypothetical protein